VASKNSIWKTKKPSKEGADRTKRKDLCARRHINMELKESQLPQQGKSYTIPAGRNVRSIDGTCNRRRNEEEEVSKMFRSFRQ